MSKATGLAHRQQIVSLKQAGHTLKFISETLNLTFSNVRDIWGRYKKDPDKSLLPNYQNCGLKKPNRSEIHYRASFWLKRLHPLWGSPRIHAGLKSRYGHKTPSIRTLNRWYKSANLVKPRSKIKHQEIGKSKAVHNTWQVDAKEQLELHDGQKGCYLTIIDEKSGAWLGSLVFFLWTYLPSSC